MKSLICTTNIGPFIQGNMYTLDQDKNVIDPNNRKHAYHVVKQYFKPVRMEGKFFTFTTRERVYIEVPFESPLHQLDRSLINHLFPDMNIVYSGWGPDGKDKNWVIAAPLEQEAGIKSKVMHVSYNLDIIVKLYNKRQEP